jgi:hypothetical protein
LLANLSGCEKLPAKLAPTGRPHGGLLHLLLITSLLMGNREQGSLLQVGRMAASYRYYQFFSGKLMGLAGGQGKPDSASMDANTGAASRSKGAPQVHW